MTDFEIMKLFAVYGIESYTRVSLESNAKSILIDLGIKVTPNNIRTTEIDLLESKLAQIVTLANMYDGNDRLDILHKGDYLKGWYLELKQRRTLSRKVQVARANKPDNSILYINESGKKSYKKLESKTNESKLSNIENMLFDFKTDFVVYTLDKCNSNGTFKTESALFKTEHFKELLERLSAIKTTTKKGMFYGYNIIVTRKLERAINEYIKNTSLVYSENEEYHFYDFDFNITDMVTFNN